MKQHLYKGNLYNTKELSEICGVKYTTLAERFKRGYTVEEAISDVPRIPESILQFDSHSDYTDWDGLTSERLYEIYIAWCLKNQMTVESKVHFTRSIKSLHPNVRIVPTRLKVLGEVMYKRVVRIDRYNI
jgi:hypothetical protein